MWHLIIPLILGEPSVPAAHREIRVEAATREECHAIRLRLRNLMFSRWPPDSNNAGVALIDQPPRVSRQWRYLSPDVGFCEQEPNPPAGR